MAKKYDFDDTNGVWRTIGGRRVFIKNGQSLSEAMIASGKFKNLRSDYRKAKEEETNLTPKQIDSGIKLEENALKGARADIKALVNNEVDYDGTKQDFINDLSKEWGIDKEKLEGIYEEESKNKVAKYFNEKEEYALKSKDYSYDYSKETLKKMSDEDLDGVIAKKQELVDEYTNKYNQDLTYDQRKTRNKQDTLWDGSMKTKYEHGLMEAQEEKFNRQKDNKTIDQLNDEMLGDKYKGSGPTPDLVYSTGRRIEIANNVDGGKTATIWKNGKIERKTNLPDNVKGDKTINYFDDYLSQLDGTNKNEGFTSQSTNPFYPDRDYTKEDLDRMADAGVKPMKNTYSGSGWEGVNAHKNLSTSEQAKAITNTMKEKYPDVKIARKSETYSGGSSIHFNIMSSDKDLYISDKDIDKMSSDQLYNSEITSGWGFERWANDNVKDYRTEHTYTDNDVKRFAKEQLSQLKSRDNQSVRGNEWYLSDYGKKVVSDLNKEADSYTYDDSDAMTDYFNHGTYMWVNIGKYDKPYQVNQKSSASDINGAIRQKAYQKYLKEHPGSKITFEQFKDMRK